MKYRSKATRVQSELMRVVNNTAQHQAMLHNLDKLKRGLKMKRKKDGRVFTVLEHTQAGLRFEEVDGLFAPEYFERAK